jgi:hypothetical protein
MTKLKKKKKTRKKNLYLSDLVIEKKMHPLETHGVAAAVAAMAAIYPPPPSS